jgi:uncharacterized iron-regulated protein
MSESSGLRLFGGDGRPVELEAAVERLAGAEVVLFGELHGKRPVHALEVELARALLRAKEGRLTLGAEMFEADDQLVVDEYLGGLIPHRHLVAEAKVWENHETDYRPLLDLALENGLRFLATNVPRRYANLVAREGLPALGRLSEEGRRYVAPLPIHVDLDAPGYRAMLGMNLPMGGMPVAPENLVAAQAVKDATMAHFISRELAPGRLFLHVNGTFHSDHRGGICWYLERLRPGVRVMTVASILGDPAVFDAEWRERGDVVVVVAES